MTRPYRLYREQVVARPLDEVFEFFSRPENLARITPPRLGFIILTPPPIRMEAGALIDYRLRVLGIPLRWTTLITAYEPPHRFVDVQDRGPYRMWRHTHTFRALPDGRTLLADEVLYELPLGILGRIAHALFVRRDVESIFDHRRRVILKIFG